MSTSVLFNGAVLYRPGAYTKIDASAFNSLALLGLGAVGLVGEADAGQPTVAKVFADAEGVKAFYKSGPLVEAANIVALPSKDPRIPSGATSIVCVKVNAATQSQLQLQTSASNSILVQSKDYGIFTNLITLSIAAGPTTGRVLTVKNNALGGKSEISPELCATARFTILYTGAAATATMTITPTSLATTTTGSVDDIAVSFASITNLADLIALITAHGNYTVVNLTGNAGAFSTPNLDYYASVDIKTAAASVYSRNFDVVNWMVNFSAIITGTRSAGTSPIGATWPDVLATTALTGAIRGISTNTIWTTALATLGTVDVQQVVPLCSQDGSVQGQSGDTYTFASIAAASDAHCALYSSTIGKSERQNWVGGALSKSALIAQANALNSVHTCLSGMQPQVNFVNGTLGFGQEYLFAAMLAGMRAGAPIAEPLTFKFPNCISVQVRDGSWNPETNQDAVDLISNGIIYARNVSQKGTRIERGLTTYIQLANDAYSEESLVQTWKLISRQFRSALEDTYTGTRGLLSNIKTVIPTLKTAADRLGEQGAITDGIVNGVTIPGFRNAKLTLAGDVLSVSCVVSPVEGINFILETIYLVPAQISV